MQNRKDKPSVHFTAAYLQNPLHRITICLVGAGGNGSQMLSVLARIDVSLRALGHKGLHVTVYDPDKVEQTNVGRQLFTPTDIGLNKAQCLVSRFNRAYGLDWDAVPTVYDMKKLANITITCVDNIKTRVQFGERFSKASSENYFQEDRPYYWMDLGNTRRTGQVILGSKKIEQPKSRRFSTVESLPTATQEFDYSKVNEKESGPSCSLAQALNRQDLFINSTLAQTAGSLLWNLLRQPMIDIRGFYLNLEDYRMSPIKL